MQQAFIAYRFIHHQMVERYLEKAIVNQVRTSIKHLM